MQAIAMTFEDCQRAVTTDLVLGDAVERVSMLDLSRVAKKIASEKGLTVETVAHMEALYRQFLALCCRYPGVTVCPTGPIDDFWHAHILDTRAYAADCDAVFGHLLHHYPYFGLEGEEDRRALERAFAQSIDLFIRHYGIDPTAGDSSHARSCRPQSCP